MTQMLNGVSPEAAKRVALQEITNRRRQQFLKDPEFYGDLGYHAQNAGKGLLAGVLGAPVDLMSMIMRPLGYSVPDEDVYASSEYIGNALGADTDRASFLAGLIGAPDSADIGKLGNIAPDVLGALTVFHGSPYKFSKFDSSRIGTGEGAQAFGHGIYLAENPEVANTYRLANSPPYMGSQPYEYAKNALQRNQGNKEAAIEDLHQKMLKARDEKNMIDYSFYQDAVNNFDELIERTPGQVYKVDLPDEAIDKMLDWDKPLSEQPEAMEAFRSAGGFLEKLGQDLKNEHAGNAYGILSRQLGGREKASEFLKEQGIPGIKYLDQGSRGAGEGTRNFVVFDDDLLTILERE